MEDILNNLISQTELDPSLTREILSISQPMIYPPKTILARPGVKCDKAAYIYSGIIKFYYLSNKGEEIILSFRVAPSFITYSFSDFFIKVAGQAYCETITEIKCYEIQSDKLLNLADSNPSIYQFLLKVATKVYLDHQSKELSFFEKSSKERYQDFVKKFSNYIDVIPSKSIASYLNIRPGSLSRIRKNLKS